MKFFILVTAIFFISFQSISVFADIISNEERQIATDEYIAILKDTHYFDFIDSRIHGIPKDDSNKKFWWGTMWTGIVAHKLNNRVTFVHSNDGSDNAGIHTSPYLETACYAYLLTGDKKYSLLARRLMRGMSAWILSSARASDDSPKILSRAFYPASVYSMEGGRDLYIDYDQSRPGKTAEDYVHVPNNPIFGDIWLKNKRSVDDIGHMIRAIAQVQSCRSAFDNEANADLDQMLELYAAWASDVDANNFIIPTFTPNAEIYIPENTAGEYNSIRLGKFDPTCVEKLAVRLLHTKNTHNLSCGDGVSLLEKISSKYLKNDAIQILRSHHVAATALAQIHAETKLADKLMSGLRDRMDRDFKVTKNNKLSPKFYIQDVPTFFVDAHNVGVAMTAEEIRFVYERLHLAYVGMRDLVNYNTFHLFDSSVPDGIYSYDPPDVGLFYRAVGTLIGTCTSALRNIKERPILDCERLKMAMMTN